jgi:phosphonate transport system substrate-binding protein
VTSHRPLRVITYLAPSIPERFFRVIADHLGERLGTGAELIVEGRTSGPLPGDDPFHRGEADVGFMCAPSLLLLRAANSPSVELIPVAMVWADQRANGRPVYFSDVVVRADSGIDSFDQLRARTWAYNDDRSLSGWHSALQRLRDVPSGSEFFSKRVASGSHLESLRLVTEGAIDAAAIDSNALIIQRARNPGTRMGLRVIESWGPWPIQPAVARASLPEEVKNQVAAHLGALHTDVSAAAFEGIPFERFAPITYDDYLSSPAVVEAARMVAEVTPE